MMDKTPFGESIGRERINSAFKKYDPKENEDYSNPKRKQELPSFGKNNYNKTYKDDIFSKDGRSDNEDDDGNLLSENKRISAESKKQSDQVKQQKAL